MPAVVGAAAEVAVEARMSLAWSPTCAKTFAKTAIRMAPIAHTGRKPSKSADTLEVLPLARRLGAEQNPARKIEPPESAA